MCLIGGGFASFYGPVLGVVVFLVLRDVLSTLTDHWMLFYGLLFMAVILFMPEGILGLVQRMRQPKTFHDTRCRGPEAVAAVRRAGDRQRTPPRPGGPGPPEGLRGHVVLDGRRPPPSPPGASPR